MEEIRRLAAEDDQRIAEEKDQEPLPSSEGKRSFVTGFLDDSG
jgi:hypothetical protein